MTDPDATSGGLVRLRVAALPGLSIWGGLGWLVVTDRYSLLAGIPFAILAIASATFLERPIRAYSETRSLGGGPSVAFRPGFYAWFLSGRQLRFAYLFNYVTVLLALSGWVFLVVHAVLDFV